MSGLKKYIGYTFGKVWDSWQWLKKCSCTVRVPLDIVLISLIPVLNTIKVHFFHSCNCSLVMLLFLGVLLLSDSTISWDFRALSYLSADQGGKNILTFIQALKWHISTSENRSHSSTWLASASQKYSKLRTESVYFGMHLATSVSVS